MAQQNGGGLSIQDHMLKSSFYETPRTQNLSKMSVKIQYESDNTNIVTLI